MWSAVANGRFDSRHAGTVPQSRRRRAVECAAWAERSVGVEVASRRLLEPISAGGFGHVFAAEHVRTHALSAVKLTAPGSRMAACVLGQEAEVLRQLFHPSIVRIEDYGDLADGRAFLAMEYAQGVELETWLEDHGPMQPERALGVLMQLASALDYMHARGFVHADLKPSHLIIDEERDDQLTLLDFGCAFDAADEVRSRDVGGTPGYMPFEQAMGSRCTQAVDIYAMAEVAKARRVPFVDLFRPSLAFFPGASQPLTVNGLKGKESEGGEKHSGDEKKKYRYDS